MVSTERRDRKGGTVSTGLDRRRAAIRLLAIKSAGYLISTVSVLLLATVSWKSASENPLLAACLVGGVVASILGMFLRWLTYQMEEGRKASGKQ